MKKIKREKLTIELKKGYKQMRDLILMKHILFIFIVMFCFSACYDKNKDTTAPDPVSDIQIIPTNGGAILKYKLPDNNDLLYVKASYMNSLGKNVFRTASYYQNQIEIEGFNDNKEHDVTIQVFDISNNASKPVSVKVVPLVSNINLVQSNIKIAPDFGGVSLTWDNPCEKTVFIYLSYKDAEGHEITKIIPSSRAKDRFIVRGMKSTEKEFFVQVEDFWGNKTEKVSKGSFTPIFEEKIDKSKWTLIGSLSINGNAWEGKTVNIWDDVIDTKESNTDNSYAIITRGNNGGQLNFPLDIVIDLHAKVVVNRITLWQRAFWYGNDTQYFYYQGENVKSFSLYISNDKEIWTKVGYFSLDDPKDEKGNVPVDAIKAAIEGHNFDLEQHTPEFRYLKFSIDENFGSENNVCISEISLFGTQKNL